MTTASSTEHFSHLFAIDGKWNYPPDGYQEEPIPVVGYNLVGTPIRQGYPAITFTWSFMKQQHMTALMAAYRDARGGEAVVTYIDRSTGLPVTAWGQMHEPVIGARQIVFYQNVGVKFTKIVPVTSWIAPGGATLYATRGASSGTPLAAGTKVERKRSTDLSEVEIRIVASNLSGWVDISRLSAIPPDSELYS